MTLDCEIAARVLTNIFQAKSSSEYNRNWNQLGHPRGLPKQGKSEVLRCPLKPCLASELASLLPWAVVELLERSPIIDQYHSLNLTAKIYEQRIAGFGQLSGNYSQFMKNYMLFYKDCLSENCLKLFSKTVCYSEDFALKLVMTRGHKLSLIIDRLIFLSFWVFTLSPKS